MSLLLSPKLQTLRTRLETTLKDLGALATEINHEKLSSSVDDMQSHLYDPFTFVIVGEVKAGKSSFVNALLSQNEEICKVAPQPMTDTIQQILYGTEQHTDQINPYLKKIYLPVEILKEISIVDTPGTNTIVEHHQEITEQFIPSSDLIVFVFESKNPYRQSAWDFFKFIHVEWQRKIIFVLQQKDLMNAPDLETNRIGVITLAEKFGVINPQVFCVSAKQEQEEKFDESGFSAIRDYIRSNITGGKAVQLKLGSTIDTAKNITARIGLGLSDRAQQLESDKLFRKDIKQTLDAQETKSHGYVKMLIENISATYDKTTQKTEDELGVELSFVGLIKRSFMGIFGSTDSISDRLNAIKKNFENDLNTSLKEKLFTGVTDLADSIQNMAKMVDLKIKTSQTILKHDHDIFSDIADRRANILKDLQDTFAQFLKDSNNFYDSNLFESRSSIAPNIAAGSGIAIVGLILAAVTNTAVFDITGGLLTAVGVLFASGTAIVKKQQIIIAFRKEVETGRENLNLQLTDRLHNYINALKKKIELNFNPFDAQLKLESESIETLNAKTEKINGALKSLQNDLG